MQVFHNGNLDKIIVWQYRSRHLSICDLRNFNADPHVSRISANRGH